MTLLLLLAISPLLLVSLTFVLEVAAGLVPLRRQSTAGEAAGATIVIPAHDEATGIASILQRLKPAAGSQFSILVVADNCSDDTAGVARIHGAEVIERSDPDHRGKGYALAFARDWLTKAPPSAVIVLDADCHTDRQSLQALVRATLSTGRPSQAVNLLEPSLTAGVMVQISSFAFLLKNLVRQRGLQRLSGGVHLTGTGMCLIWPQFRDADLATADIVEDIRLGLELKRRGEAPMLIEQARVWSPHAAQADTLSQRSRWEGGFLSLARKAAPIVLKAGFATGSSRTLLSGLDLLIPPLALLGVISVAVLAITGGLTLAGWVAPVAFILPLIVASAVAIAVLAAWWLEGRPFLRFTALLKLPLYVVWKIPMYLKVAAKGAPAQWQRTRRPGQTSKD